MKKRILCGVFGFYLSLAFLIPQLSALVLFEFYKDDIIISRFSGSAAAESAYESILNNCETVADPCGMPYSVYSGVFSKDKIQQDMLESITASIHGEIYTVDTEEMSSALKQNVIDFLAEEDGVVDFTEYESEIESFCSQSLRIYDAIVNLSIYKKIPDLYNKLDKYILIISIVGVILTVIGVYFLNRLNDSFGEMLRDVSYSVFASGFFNSICAFMLIRSQLLMEIQLSPAFLRDGLRSLIYHAFRSDLYIGVIVSAFAFFLFLISVLINSATFKRRNKDIK